MAARPGLLAWFTLGIAAPVGWSQTPLFTLKPDSAGDVFGWAADGAGDVDGDGVADVVVGARRDEAPGLPLTLNAGSATVFSGADGTVIHRVFGAAPGQFGHRVAGVGDVDQDGFADILVGNPTHVGGAGQALLLSGRDTGEIYAFLGGTTGDQFGMDVGGVGDVNLDGVPDLIVGARWAEPAGFASGFDCGSATVLSGADGSPLHVLYGDFSADHFGMAVDGIGDVDLDGRGDFLVGAPQCNAAVGPCGATGYARLFTGSSGATLRTLFGEGASDQFGISTSRAGDVDADGTPDFLVGAWRNSAGGVSAGSAYAFSGADASQLHAFYGATEDHFGFSVAAAGDLDGDGFDDVIIGAPEMCQTPVPGECPAPGYLQVRSGRDGSVLYTASGEAFDDNFGMAVSGAFDVNQDGVPDFLAGSRYSDHVGDFSGSAVLFSGADLTLSADEHLVSVAAGGSQTLQLAAGSTFALQGYLLLGSLSGTSPGLALGPLLLPLNPDAYFQHTAAQPGAPPLAGSAGVLNAQGASRARFSLPPGSAPSLIGVSAAHAYLLFDTTTGAPLMASNAIPVTLVP